MTYQEEMNKIGILSPTGEFYPCESFDHLILAKEIADKIRTEQNLPLIINMVDCEDYLQKLGYIIIKARDVFGRVGWLDDNKQIIRMTKKQKDWLEKYYQYFGKAKQECVDELIKNGYI